MQPDFIKRRFGFNSKELAMLVGLMFVSVHFTAHADVGDILCKTVDMLTGKWLFAVSIFAVLGSFAALIFGAELSDMLKKVVTVITGIAIVFFFLNGASMLGMTGCKG